jgi:hypothetical protein
MESQEPTSIAARKLRDRYLKAIFSNTLGGSAVLSELAELAVQCCAIPDDGKAAVAVALSAVLGFYADDRNERAVPGEEHDQFRVGCQPTISDAIEFIANQKSADPVRLAASLARCMIRT